MQAALNQWMQILTPYRTLQWAVVAALSLVFVAAMEVVHLPAALLLGPMIAGILFSAAGGTVRVPQPAYTGAQALIGVMIAGVLPFSHVSDVFVRWPVLLFGVGSTLLAATAIGWLLARWRVLPGTTAIWGSSPGAASTMVVLAEAFGADVRLVAFMQYLRVMCVAGLASVIASITMSATGHTPPPIAWFPALEWTSFAGALAVAFGGAALAQLLKIPAGGLLLPMVLTIALKEADILHLALPPWLLALSYALFGWAIGLRFTPDILRHAARALPRLLIAIAALITLCAGFGVVLSFVADIDLLTAYLATSPGGADSVAIIAASSKVDVPFVMTMQMARFLVVTATGPMLARFLAGKLTRASR